MPFIIVNSRRLEYERIDVTDAKGPTIVFLHEGLGCIAMWKDFPSRVAHATNRNVLVYSRYGYGQSDPLAEARSIDYLHREALDTLPELLDELGVEKPILFGHSDGGSIALLHAGGTARLVTGLIVMAPHVMVEDVTIAGIEAATAAYELTRSSSKLARYHADADTTFRGWSDAWLNPDFRDWNMEEYLPRITCPILAIQGKEDEYATLEQLERIARGAADVDLLALSDCRHSPHRDQSEAVIAATTRFVDRLHSEGGASGVDWHRRHGGILDDSG
jgi:pimeloyl-ACP methyl ester carboxylesterase